MVVTFGEGRVYAGLLDATVAAIDQQTGEENWRVPVVLFGAAVAVSAAGRNNMPWFRDAYSIDELYDVATFFVERLAAE